MVACWISEETQAGIMLPPAKGERTNTESPDMLVVTRYALSQR
jgi:hypothetical protein